MNLDFLSLLRTHERGSDWTGCLNLPRIIILVTITNQCIFFFIAIVEIANFDRRSKGDFVLKLLGWIDDKRVGQLSLKLVDLGLHHALILTLGMILGVLL